MINKSPSFIRCINCAVDVGFLGILFIIEKSTTQPTTIKNFLIAFSYFFILEFSFGKTIGKLVTGTKVASTDGSKPTASQIFVRSLVRFVPLEAVPFLWGADPHDDISKTYVTAFKADYRTHTKKYSTVISKVSYSSLTILFLFLAILHTGLLLNKSYFVNGLGPFNDYGQLRAFLNGWDQQNQLVLSQTITIKYFDMPYWVPNLIFIGYFTVVSIALLKSLTAATTFDINNSPLD